MTQPIPFREQLKTLEQLQELDLKIDGLKKNKNALPAALKALDDSMAKVKLSMDAKKTAIAEIEKVQSQTKAALELNKDRLTRSSSRLESVQNSQEFQAVNKEIEQLNKLNVSLEEQTKKSAAETDTVQKALAEFTTQYDKLKADRDAQAALVSGQSDKFDTEIGSLMKERANYTGRIDAKMLTLYDRVRAARNGLGIVPAVAGRCKGCNMMVPPQLYNMIQRATEMHSCPSCHRILFVPATPSNDQAKPEVSPS